MVCVVYSGVGKFSNGDDVKPYDLNQQLLADEVINNDLLKLWQKWCDQISEIIGEERVRDTFINRFMMYAIEMHIRDTNLDRQHFLDKCEVLYDLMKKEIEKGERLQ